MSAFTEWWDLYQQQHGLQPEAQLFAQAVWNVAVEKCAVKGANTAAIESFVRGSEPRDSERVCYLVGESVRELFFINRDGKVS